MVAQAGTDFHPLFLGCVCVRKGTHHIGIIISIFLACSVSI